MEAGKAHDIQPAGLGARDTLRLEKGYCLYGHEINDQTSPIEAGLGWITKRRGNFRNALPLAGNTHRHGLCATGPGQSRNRDPGLHGKKIPAGSSGKTAVPLSRCVLLCKRIPRFLHGFYDILCLQFFCAAHGENLVGVFGIHFPMAHMGHIGQTLTFNIFVRRRR